MKDETGFLLYSLRGDRKTDDNQLESFFLIICLYVGIIKNDAILLIIFKGVLKFIFANQQLQTFNILTYKRK